MIADKLHASTIVRSVATLLGPAPSTISPELCRNRGGLAAYRLLTADQLARKRHGCHLWLDVRANVQPGS